MVQPNSHPEHPAGGTPPQGPRANNQKQGEGAERAVLQLSDHEGVWYAKIGEITYLEADGNYSTVHFYSGESRVVCRPLRDFDTRLHDCGFLRVHQSYLVNLSYVKAYLREQGGTISLTGGEKVYLSRSHRLAFFAAMDDRTCQ